MVQLQTTANDINSQLISQYQSSWVVLTIISLAVFLTLTAWGFSWLSLFPKLRLNRSLYSLFCESLIHGFIIFSVMAFAGVFIGIPIHKTFITISFIFVAIQYYVVKKPSGIKTIWPQIASSMADSRRQELALILIVAGSFLWTTNNIRGLGEANAGIVLVPWIDTYFHAKQIGNFSLFNGDFGMLNLTKYGELPPPYHYGSYMVSALISYFGSIPSIQVATSIYPMLGMMLSGVSMFVLSGLMSGSRGSLLAITILFFLPDPSCWATGIPKSYSYFFFQQVGIGGAYAVAIMGLALSYSLRAFKIKSLKFCLVAFGLFSIASLFKVQIFLAYGIFFFIFVIFNAHWVSWKMRLAAAFLLLCFFYMALMELSKIPNAPTFEITLSGIEDNVQFISRFFSSSTNPFFVTIVSLPIAAAAVFLVVYGPIFPASVILAFKLRKNSAARNAIFMLVFFLISHACIRLLIADNVGSGDGAEVNRKTFVWPYFVVVSCFSSMLLNYLDQENIRYFVRKPVLAIMFSCLFFLTTVSARNVQDWPGVGGLTNSPIPIGIFESAMYLRRHSLPGEVIQPCENDNFNRLSALAERPVFIARYTTSKAEMSVLEQDRFDMVDRILQQSDAKIAMHLMTQSKISWFLMSRNCVAGWEAESTPVFSSSGYRIYKVFEL